MVCFSGGVQNGTNSRGRCLFPGSSRWSLLMPRWRFYRIHVKPFVWKCQTRVYSEDVNFFFLVYLHLNLVYEKYIEKSRSVDHYFCKNWDNNVVLTPLAWTGIKGWRQYVRLHTLCYQFTQTKQHFLIISMAGCSCICLASTHKTFSLCLSLLIVPFTLFSIYIFNT